MVCSHFAKIYLLGRCQGGGPLLSVTIDLICDNWSFWLYFFTKSQSNWIYSNNIAKRVNISIYEYTLGTCITKYGGITNQYLTLYK